MEVSGYVLDFLRKVHGFLFQFASHDVGIL